MIYQYLLVVNLFPNLKGFSAIFRPFTDNKQCTVQKNTIHFLISFKERKIKQLKMLSFWHSIFCSSFTTYTNHQLAQNLQFFNCFLEICQCYLFWCVRCFFARAYLWEVWLSWCLLCPFIHVYYSRRLIIERRDARSLSSLPSQKCFSKVSALVPPHEHSPSVYHLTQVSVSQPKPKKWRW